MFTQWFLCLLCDLYVYTMISMFILWSLCLYYDLYVYTMISVFTMIFMLHGDLYVYSMISMFILKSLCLHNDLYGFGVSVCSPVSPSLDELEMFSDKRRWQAFSIENVPITSLLPTSVTRWLDFLYKIWPFVTKKICPVAYKIGQSRLKIVPILNKPSKSYQRHVRFHQSGEISPNLVTLLPT